MSQTLKGSESRPGRAPQPAAHGEGPSRCFSVAQERLLERFAAGNPVFHLSAAFRLRGPLDGAVVERSLNEIIRRHEVLRTTVAVRDGQPRPAIAPELRLTLPRHDLTRLPRARRESELRRLAADTARRPFALERGPLLRAALLLLAPGEHFLVLTFHRLVADPASLEIAGRELILLCRAFAAGRRSPLRELPLQYGDFAARQRQWLRGDACQRQVAWWRRRLAGVPALLELPTDHPRGPLPSYRGGRQVLTLGPELAAAAGELSRRQAVALSTVLLAAFKVLLGRYTGQDDLVVGSPVANRDEQSERLIGPFANPLALRTELGDDPAFHELVARLATRTREAQEHADLPFETLVDALEPQRDTSHQPLFQVAFIFCDSSPAPKLGDLALDRLALDNRTASFDLTLGIEAGERSLNATLEYDAELFTATTAARVLRHYRTLLAGALADPDRPVPTLPLLAAAERHQLLAEWNPAGTPYPAKRPIQALCEAWAAVTPDAVAVVVGDRQLSYRELNGLELVHLGGEAISWDLVRQIAEVVDEGCRVYNGYGPTETSINSTVFRLRGRPLDGGVRPAAVPIGRATANTVVYVLDRRGRPLPIGVPGELAIGGQGVSRGYQKRSAPTAERFVPDPFSGRAGGRLYRSGDLVRWLGDGELELLGRIDHHFRRLPEAVATDPDQAVGELPRLDEAERRQILERRRRLGAAPAAPASAPTAREQAEARRRTRVSAQRDRLSAAKRALLARRLGGRTQSAPRRDAMARRPADEPASLSFAQERLWFLDRLEPGFAAYNLPVSLRLRGRLDHGALARSWNEIRRRHEVLRTTFRLAAEGPAAGRPIQVVAPASPQSVPVVDLTALPAAARDGAAAGAVAGERGRPFDLTSGPLLRIVLLRLGDADHVLFINVHHIVFDGWSLGILIKELAALYRAPAGAPPLPELPVQYADFALWQRRHLSGRVLEEQLRYWKQRLAGAPETLDLPADRPRPAVQTFRGESVIVTAGRAVAERLQALARETDATLFMILLAAFKVVLYRHTGQTDLMVGTPIAGRNRSETEALIGFFINTLVLRTDLAADPTFRELLARVREVALGAYAHQDLPFEKLVEELAPRRDLSRTPLFQIFFNLINLESQSVTLPGLTLDAGPRSGKPLSKFDLTLYVTEGPDELGIALVYNAELFDRPRMAALAAAYVALLDEVAAAPDRAIGDYTLRPESAAALLPDPCRPLASGAAADVALPELFRAAAERTPERPAVSDPWTTWSYGELEARSNRLAHALRGRGIGAGEVVAIYGERSAALVAALIGVLKAGAAFLILDPAHPPARLADCARQAAPRAWVQVGPGDLLPELTLTSDPPSIPPCPLRLAHCEESAELAAAPSAPPAPAAGVDDLAYVAFTSGTSGRPRGIRGTQRPVVAFLAWFRERFALSAEDRFALLSGLSHDPLLRDLWTPLVLGAHLAVPPAAIRREPAALRAWLRDERVSVVHLTPSLGRLLSHGAADGDRLPAVRRMVFGGEPLTFGDAARCRRWAPAAVCVNAYGATETPQIISCYPIAEEEARRDDEARVPVGWGRDGVELLVIGPRGGLCGIGERGEIAVRSPHLALGYLGDEALTRERFIANPWRREEGDRVYLTGDLGRYRADGAVELAGRADRQVNVRGYRVEPAEAEAILAAHPAVREAAVVDVPGPGGELRLAAYLVAGDEAPAAGQLRAFLAARLPDYLLPAHFVTLPALPLTPAGKLDRAALPPPDADLAEAGEIVPPRDPLEHELARIWEELLETGPISIRSNFFELGGHSLLGVRLMAAIRDRCGRDLPLTALFQHGTVEQLAALVRSAGGEPPAATVVEIRKGGGDRVPLFCVHPAGGGVLCYHHLARALDRKQPVYGLQARGLRVGETPRQGMDEMADAYLEALRRVQPAGPYALLGWSFGALVAYEMARRLHSAGQQVALLANLDGRLHDPDREPEVLTEADVLIEVLHHQIPLSAADLEGLTGDEQLAVALDRLRDKGLLPPGFGVTEARCYLETCRINVAIRRAYAPEPFSGSMVLFRTADQAAGPDPNLKWRDLVRGGVEVVAAPGEHLTMVYPPHVEVLAGHLQRLLDACRH